jgi:hypothetical protein
VTLQECLPGPLHLPPPAPRLPLGRRGHRFPRSHGPAEHKVKTRWLTLCLPPQPRARAAPHGASAVGARRSRSECQTNPSAARIGAKPQAMPGAPGSVELLLAGASRPGAVQPDADRNTEGTQEQQESWRIRRIMRQKTNLLAEAQRMFDRIAGLARTLRRARRKLASKKTEGTQDPQKLWRNPEDDASDEPGGEKCGSLSLRSGFC